MKLFSDFVKNIPHDYAASYAILNYCLKNKDVFVFILIKLDN